MSEVLVQLVAAVMGSSVLSGLITHLVNRRANRIRVLAEAATARVAADNAEIDGAERITRIALDSLIGPLERRIDHLSDSLDARERQLHQLGAYVDLLIATMRAASLPVPPQPFTVAARPGEGGT